MHACIFPSEMSHKQAVLLCDARGLCGALSCRGGALCCGAADVN